MESRPSLNFPINLWEKNAHTHADKFQFSNIDVKRKYSFIGQYKTEEKKIINIQFMFSLLMGIDIFKNKKKKKRKSF